MLFSCSAGILHGVVCFLVQEEQVWWNNPIEAMRAAANDLRWTPAVSFRVGCCLCVCVDVQFDASCAVISCVIIS